MFTDSESPVRTGHAHAGGRDAELVLVGAEDLARLGHHLALLGRVVVAVLERLDLGQDVEGDPVRVDLGRRHLGLVEQGVRSGLRAPRSPAGRCPRRTGRWRRRSARCPTARWIGAQRDHHLHRRAVGVGDDPAVAVERLGVDLRDHERDVVVHAPEAGVVDHDGARRRRSRGAHSALTAPPAEESTRSRPWIASRRQRPALELAAGERELASRPSARRRTARPRRREARARASTSRIVEPTAPVAPTTPTL